MEEMLAAAEAVVEAEDREERASRALLESLVQLRAFNELLWRNRSERGCTAPVPAAQSSIEALEMFVLEDEVGDGDGGGSRSIGECSICMESFRDGCVLNRMPCSHVFHHLCLLRWLVVNHTCPYCRFSLPARDR